MKCDQCGKNINKAYYSIYSTNTFCADCYSLVRMTLNYFKRIPSQYRTIIIYELIVNSYVKREKRDFSCFLCRKKPTYYTINTPASLMHLCKRCGEFINSFRGFRDRLLSSEDQSSSSILQVLNHLLKLKERMINGMLSL
ncbi:MAG: hypothetical protein ACTSQY_00545 [Candidatus Odinarchaeia archaeon]|nr:MAG: hypothetical protein [Lokiarchaeota virus Fenrir Meg22_1012]URC17290.1 MAG: hypothetical protein [Lokiarchaeota virus Fenrir Meg22_1214]